jgi:hypothetical protein
MSDDSAHRTILGDLCGACGAIVPFAELTRIGYLPQGNVFTQTPCPICGHVQDFADSRSLEEMGRDATVTTAIDSPRCDRCGELAADGNYRQGMNRLETFELGGPFLVWLCHKCHRCLNQLEGGG